MATVYTNGTNGVHNTNGVNGTNGLNGTNGVKSSQPDIPPVVLDKTLYDFLSEDLEDGEEVEAQCAVKPHSDPAFGEAVPLSSKYLIHCAQVGNPDDLAHLQLEICSFLLNFFAGPMNIIMIGSEGDTADESLYRDAVHENAEKCFSVIDQRQRPRVTTFENVADFWKYHDQSKVRFCFGMDVAERVPGVFEPELIYLLNSKRWLANAIKDAKGMHAPNDLVVDTGIKCSTHATEDGHWYFGGNAQDQGTRRHSITTMLMQTDECLECLQGIKNEIQRVREVIEARPLPFVLKLTQSLSSVGTNIVKTESQRLDVIFKITRTLLDYLPRITAANAHLYTMTLIISDFIPGNTMALNFYVRRDGSCVFHGACHQLSTGMTGRQNTAITYSDQQQLQKKYMPTLEKMSKLLHDAGYYGQVGVDIMEDEQGRQYIIDANVRQALSMLLYALKGHCEKRNFGTSMVFECLFMRVSREELIQAFAKEFVEGRIILLGSTRLGKKNVWGFGIVLCGETKAELDVLVDRLGEYETTAHIRE